LVLLYYFTYIDDARSNTNQVYCNFFCLLIFCTVSLLYLFFVIIIYLILQILFLDTCVLSLHLLNAFIVLFSSVTCVYFM